MCIEHTGATFVAILSWQHLRYWRNETTFIMFDNDIVTSYHNHDHPFRHYWSLHCRRHGRMYCRHMHSLSLPSLWALPQYHPTIISAWYAFLIRTATFNYRNIYLKERRRVKPASCGLIPNRNMVCLASVPNRSMVGLASDHLIQVRFIAGSTNKSNVHVLWW